MSKRPYETLIVWKEADALCLYTYDVTKTFPQEEKFCLVQQMRKCGYGIPMCIVEGSARKTVKDRKHFITIAIGSLEELHYQFSLANRLSYLSTDQFEKADDHIKRLSYLLQKFRSAIT